MAPNGTTGIVTFQYFSPLLLFRRNTATYKTITLGVYSGGSQFNLESAIALSRFNP